MNIGEAIKRLRLAKGWEQKELGFMLNVSNKTISSWERNRTEPNMDMIEKMCALFGCTKSEFFEEVSGDNMRDYFIRQDSKKITVEVPAKQASLFLEINNKATKLSEKELRAVREMIRSMAKDDKDSDKK